MAASPEVKVHIAADTAALRAELAKMSSEIGRHASVAEKALGGVGSALGLIKGGLAGLAGGGLISIGRSALDAAGGIGELADQIGIGTRALQELEYGAATAGVKTEDLHGLLTKLTARIGEAADGNDQAIASFDALGVSILDAAGKTRSTEAVLKDIAEAYAQTGDKAVAAARLKDIFGKSAQKLIPLLKDGASGLDRMAANAEHVKAVLSDGLIATADEAADKIAAMEKAAAKAAQTFMAKLAPGITAVLDAYRRGSGGSTMEEEIADQITRVADAERALEAVRNRSAWMFGSRGKAGAVASAETDVKRQRAELARLQALVATRAAAQPFAKDAAPGIANPEGKGALAAQTSEAEKYAEGLDKATLALDEQAAALGRTAAQVAVYSALVQAGVDTSDLVVDASGRVTGGLSAQEMALANAARRTHELKSAEEARRAAQDRLNQSEADAWDRALKQTEARDKVIDKMEGEVVAARQLQAALGDGEDSYARTKLVMDAVNEARRAGIVLSESEMERIRANAAALVEAQTQTQAYRNMVQELGAFGDQAFSRIGSAATQMAMEGNDAFASLRNIGKAVVSELYQEFFKLAAVNPLKNLMGLGGGALPTLGGLANLLFGSGASQLAAANAGIAASPGMMEAFAGAFASGTPSSPAGWALVGEKGPELMKIPGGTQIFPADISARLAAGDWPSINPPALPEITAASSNRAGAVVSNHFVIDARGADREGLARLEQRITMLNATVERRAINAVTDARQRGGAVARALGGR
ncbi:Phage-related minor tail protein [Paramagnetospirillum caucaseum]|uniref:Phage-related minor tail protein n=1 Tax=Paramagnetospirillum caucaseum TaxID=1244869 RepID=M2YEH4_9PROT|nr:hypothetical protein [Paramagnetospirillum caucaseum]EME71386.1 Phage-related minor tail protein [Paramagnetospirillum caucaseum]